MKQFYQTLICLLPLFGGTVSAQTGMTVFGDCYVSETASIGFFGDELALRADVKGGGSLVIAGKDTQTIIARDQKIDRLVIVNPTVVKLKGKLTISKSLVVKLGTLSVLPLAQLRVPQLATIFVAEGGQIIHAGIVLHPGTEEVPLTKQAFGKSEGITCGIEMPPTRAVPLKLQIVGRLSVYASYRSPYLKALAPPPWWM
jgi:hypothetical protein